MNPRLSPSLGFFMEQEALRARRQALESTSDVEFAAEPSEPARQAPRRRTSSTSQSTVIKDRGVPFGVFYSSIQSVVNKFWKTKEFSITQGSLDNKKRIKYWASRLMEPTKFNLSRVTFTAELTNGECKVETKEVKGDFSIVPLGIDLWSTVGGYNGNTMNWGDVMLSFVPSKELLGAIGNKNVVIAFAMAKDVQMASKTEEKEDTTRHIQI